MEKKNLVMVCLCAAIAIMAVAYAAFSTTLTVDGTINATGNFAVEYVETGSCTVSHKEGADTPKGTIVKNDATSAKLNVELYTPLDEVTCTIKVKNTGNLSAKLTTAHVISNELTESTQPIAVTATSTKEVLNANDEDTITVVVKYNWADEKQPDTSKTKAEFTITSSYAQNI